MRSQGFRIGFWSSSRIGCFSNTDLLSIFPFPVCNSVTMDIDETSVNAVLSLLLAFIKHLLTRHLFYLRFGNSYRLTPGFLPGWQKCCCKHERKRKKLKKKVEETVLQKRVLFKSRKTNWSNLMWRWLQNWKTRSICVLLRSVRKGKQEKTLFDFVGSAGWLHFLQCCTLYFAQQSKDSKAAWNHELLQN